MTNSGLTDLEFNAVAVLIGERRTRNRLSQWDRAGIVAALRKLTHTDIHAMLAAGFAAADDPQALKPVAITWAQNQPTRLAANQPRLPDPTTQAAHQAATHCQDCDHRGYLPGGFRCPHDGQTAQQRQQRVHDLVLAAKANIKEPPTPNPETT